MVAADVEDKRGLLRFVMMVRRKSRRTGEKGRARGREREMGGEGERKKFIVPTEKFLYKQKAGCNVVNERRI